jgi:hypothetical protein
MLHAADARHMFFGCEARKISYLHQNGGKKSPLPYRDSSELLGVIGGRLLPVRRHYTVLSGVQKWREAGGAKMAGRDLRTKWRQHHHGHAHDALRTASSLSRHGTGYQSII